MDYFYFIALLGSSLIMSFGFFIERKMGSGYIDSIWALNVGLFGFLAALPFSNLRSLIIGGLILVWALRLGGHILIRTKEIPEDPRYSEIKKSWGEHASRNLFWFLQIQAVCAFVLIAAARLGTTRTNQDWLLIDILALIVAIIAIVGEGIADYQLRKFKANNPPKSICNIGLWKLSRHPNYFFEFLFWFGISIFALGGGSILSTGLLALFAPLMMYYLLNFASGIPPLEEYMIKSRGEKFKQYMAVTRPFFPIPK